MTDRPDPHEALGSLLRGALLLGLELDTRFRVLAATVEPTAPFDPGRTDRRLQVALHPCSLFEVRLVRTAPDSAAVLERFSLEQLLDVVVALDTPAIDAVDIGGRPPSWRDVSLEGRSQAPDGRRHRIRFSVSDGARTLEVHATFDDVDVRMADGTQVDLRT